MDLTFYLIMGIKFITKEGKKINADINGSYNIMRKAVPNTICHGIEGLGVNPVVLTIKK